MMTMNGALSGGVLPNTGNLTISHSSQHNRWNPSGGCRRHTRPLQRATGFFVSEECIPLRSITPLRHITQSHQTGRSDRRHTGASARPGVTAATDRGCAENAYSRAGFAEGSGGANAAHNGHQDVLHDVAPSLSGDPNGPSETLRHHHKVWPQPSATDLLRTMCQPAQRCLPKDPFEAHKVRRRARFRRVVLKN